MTFEEALAATGPRTAAWEAWTLTPEVTLRVFAVQSKPALLSKTTVAESRREELSNELRRRGVRVGTCVPLDDHFWCADDQGFALWSIADGLELEGKHGALHLSGGRRIANTEIRQVVSFVDDDMVRRGVRLDLNDGSSVVVAQVEDSAALADPTYNADNLALDASWARHLGTALASWLGKPRLDQVP